ncbi:heavy metal translocating P-type ATPase, partial [Streptomyces sp. NPDC048279]
MTSLLTLAAAAGQPGEHPPAPAVVAAARDKSLALPAAEDFTSAPGIGAGATADGHEISAGATGAVAHQAGDRGLRRSVVAGRGACRRTGG